MPRGAKAKLSKHEIATHDLKYVKTDTITRIKQSESIPEIVDLSHNEDPDIRLKAVQQLCPCRVRFDDDSAWQRLFQLADDPDVKVREQVLHNICDGSPPRLEAQVREALDKFNSDRNSYIRRRAHKVIGSLLKTGDWNVL